MNFNLFLEVYNDFKIKNRDMVLGAFSIKAHINMSAEQYYQKKIICLNTIETKIIDNCSKYRSIFLISFII